jgi:hypothetical protein
VGDYQKAGVMAGARAAAAAASAPKGAEAVNAVGCSFQNFVFTTDEDF